MIEMCICGVHHQDHIAEEVTWDTDASLYNEAGDEGVSAGPDRSGLAIQDVLLPGYHDEWVETRPVRGCTVAHVREHVELDRSCVDLKRARVGDISVFTRVRRMVDGQWSVSPVTVLMTLQH